VAAPDFDIIHANDLEWEGAAAHRSGGVQFKTLFTNGGGANNFWFTLTQIDEYSTPRHRHNFDQVRYMLDGGFGFGPKVQEEGQVGYFSEGSYYEQQSQGPNTHVFVQCEGGSRSKYLSPQDTRAIGKELAEIGRFENGHYIPPGATEADARDGFEAVWEHATGEPVRYSEPRFPEPVIVDPANFDYIDDATQSGVAHQQLMRVTERDLRIGFDRVTAGARYEIVADERDTTIYFVESGEGTVTGPAGQESPYGTWSAFRLGRGARAKLVATTATKLFVLGLPV